VLSDINDLDHVAHHVQGSEQTGNTCTMRSGSDFIPWCSLMVYHLPPADLNHPIALYYADQDLQIFPGYIAKMTGSD